MGVVVTVIALVVVLVAAAVLVLGTVRRKRSWPAWPDDRGGWDDEGPAGVREPRRPLPSGSAASAAAIPDDST